MTSVLEIEVIRDTGTLARLVPEWWELWERSPATTPFQSPPWLLAWWEAFEPGRLSTVAIRDRCGLVALALFYLENSHSGKRLLPVGISLSDYMDVLVRPGATEGISVITDHLALCPSWEICEMGGLLPGAAALALPCLGDCSDKTEDDEVCPVLDLPPGPVDAGSHPAIPAAQRRKLRMARHRLERTASAAILAARDLSHRSWVNALIRLHTTRWQERGMSGVLSDPRVQTFHHASVPGLIEYGLARLFAVRIGNEIAGVYYGFSDRGRAYAYLGGFDPRFAYYSPGTVLLGHAIEDALRDGAREFHFLRGREGYKYAWGAVDRMTLRRRIVRKPNA